LNGTKAIEKLTRFSLTLFGKPAWEIEELESEVNFKVLEEISSLGKELQQRLWWVARTGKELLNHGWEAYGTLYDIEFYKPISLEKAKRELKELGLDSEKLGLEEEELAEGT
jgi:hypothetical protein